MCDHEAVTDLAASFFKSRTVAGHVIRGALGFGFLAIAMVYAAQLGWWAIVPALAALVCFRGCPMCWTFGLIETVFSRKTGVACADGSCENLRKAD